jgi:hypothetical protein
LLCFEMMERLLLLDGGITIGIFAPTTPSSKLAILLSCDCNFVQIFQGLTSRTYLSRYVPKLYQQHVSVLLTFRNTFNHETPYFVENFHGKELFTSELSCSWKGSQPLSSNSLWTTMWSTNKRSAISLCPFHRRISYSGQVLFQPDSSCEIFSAHYSSHFPLYRCPLEVSNLFKTLCKISSDEIGLKPRLAPILNHTVVTNTLRSSVCGAHLDTTSQSMFNLISEELLLLHEDSYFPTCGVVLVESLDNVIYTFTRAGDSPHLEDGEVEVEAWLDKPHLVDVKQSDCPPPELLILKGSIVRYFYSAQSPPLDTHISVLSLPLESSESPLLHRRLEVAHLIDYRNHLFSRKERHSILELDMIIRKCQESQLGLIFNPFPPPPCGLNTSEREGNVPVGGIIEQCRLAGGGCLSLVSDGRVRAVFPAHGMIYEYFPLLQVNYSDLLLFAIIFHERLFKRSSLTAPREQSRSIYSPIKYILQKKAYLHHRTSQREFDETFSP